MALILSRAEVQQCLTITEAIALMRPAFAALNAGQAQLPPRAAISLQDEGVALLMPSLLLTADEDIFGLKVITVSPHNSLRSLPLTHASVLLLDAVTGKTVAILEGGWLTTMRTGAVVGLATDLLARRDAEVLALFGAGAQAPAQVLAIDAVRPLREVRVVNRNDEHYERLASSLKAALGPASPLISRSASAKEALMDASVVACATVSTSPLFQWEDVEPGTHINAIGAFTPDMCEVDAETLAHARIVVDQREAALSEAGDLIQALKKGTILGPDQWTELGEIVLGKQPAREGEQEVTVFKSVGVAIQDAAVAFYVYKRARELKLGVEIEV